MFAHLHAHTTYSLLDGYGAPSAFAPLAIARGQTALAITDHGTISGHVAHADACKEAGIAPVFGVEFYLVDDMTAKGPTEQDEARIKDLAANAREAAKMRKELKRGQEERYHVVALAIDSEGYANLRRLVTRSHLEGFYRKPRIDVVTLAEHSAGLAILTACVRGAIPQAILAGEGRAEAEKWRELFGSRLFFEIMPLDFHEQRKINLGLMEIARELGVGVVATNDVHYPSDGDAKAQDLLLAVGTGKQLDDPDRFRFTHGGLWLRTEEEMRAAFGRFHPDLDTADVDRAIALSGDLAFSFNVDPLASRAELPTFPLPPEFDSAIEYLRHLCRIGYVERGFDVAEPATQHAVADRVRYELDVIGSKGFADYFLICWDAIKFAHEQGIAIGPGRGSAAGSLAAYLLGVTGIDPLRYRLSFERFLPPHRNDYPDIDIDVEDARRDEIRAHLEGKYGADCIANVATLNAIRFKQSVRDSARVHGVPHYEVDQALALIGDAVDEDDGDGEDVVIDLESGIARGSGPFSEFRAKYPEVVAGAVALRGQLRAAGVHAAGIVIADRPLVETTAIELRSKAPVVSLTKYECERLGLVKFDLLGLKKMTVIAESLRLINTRRGLGLTVAGIMEQPDDGKTFDELGAGRTACVFQFNKRGGRRLCERMKPRNVEDLATINALDRPGPLDSGATELYLERRAGKEVVPRIHATYDAITAESYGLPIYQEQVMSVCRDLAGMSWEQVHRVRKIISLKLDESEFEPHERAFVEGATAKGCNERAARRIWESFRNYAGYAFNRSHAVAYALIGYVCAYLKTHYPLEYLCAEAQHGTNPEEAIREAKRFGVSVGAPDVNQSGFGWSLDGDVLVAGFSSVKGIGESAAIAIVETRKAGPFRDLIDFLSRAPKRNVHKGIAERLARLGAFRSIHPNTAAVVAFLPAALEIREKGRGLFEDGEMIPPDLAKRDARTPREILKAEAALLPFVTQRAEDCYPEVLAAIHKSYGRRVPISRLVQDGIEKRHEEQRIIVGTLARIERERADPGGRKRSAALLIEDASGDIILKANPYSFDEDLQRLADAGTGSAIVACASSVSERTAEVREIALCEHFADYLDRRSAGTTSEENLEENPGIEAANLRPAGARTLKAAKRVRRPHVCGIMVRVWSTQTRGGDGPEMGFAELRDETGLGFVLIWPDSWEWYCGRLTEGGIYEAKLGRTRDGTLCCDTGKGHGFNRLDEPDDEPGPPALPEDDIPF